MYAARINTKNSNEAYNHHFLKQSQNCFQHSVTGYKKKKVSEGTQMIVINEQRVQKNAYHHIQNIICEK